MRIPNRLSALLQTDNKLNGTVLQTISIVQPWFEDNKLVFFPEYTDHGPKHIEEVFEAAELLITETAWPSLGSQDVATLVLGIILHDCAMHLSEDGFVSLMTDRLRTCDEGFRDKPWPQLWDEFMVEAKRFDERKLKALFDDVKPVQPPSLDSIEMSKRDRLLIGEFLRRHHPRLAHEIALLGVPGAGGKSLSLGDLPQHIKQLGGLVARSHGLDLRVSVDYLNHRSKWGARRTLGVHITYLMALVRIADYLQIHSSRAPQEVLQVRSLRSPVSRGEWNAHAAIKDIHQETDDPEALWVEGMPEDIQTYLRLKHLLTDIQRELDDSWAVLGEVYGRIEELRGFGLRLRRIKSNLHDTESFAKTVTYVPSPASLHSAGVDLLKLLITPLYGDKPEVGIRELLQNAVDACRELKDYLDKNPQLRDLDLREQIADVVIELEEKDDKTKWITVSDRGIGMTVDTILNYFLKAGASFRKSFTWRKQHEDEHGETKVLRSGRFGIGVLAGFLLGSEIRVTTRHITSKPNEGVSFICRLEDEHIQLNKTSTAIGTSVSIQIPRGTYRRLLEGASDRTKDSSIYTKWDWYCLTEPAVYRITPAGQSSQEFKLPLPDSSLPSSWRRINHPDYRDIHWTYLASAHDLTCNGIAIADLNAGIKHYLDPANAYQKVFDNNGLLRPKISVFDPHGSFPLNLARTALSASELPFEDEILNGICHDILAFLIARTPHKRPGYASGSGHNSYAANKLSLQVHHRHPAVRSALSYYYHDDGLALLDPFNVHESRTKQLLAFSNPSLLNFVSDRSFEPYLEIPGLEVTLGSRFLGWIQLSSYRLIVNRSLILSYQSGSRHDFLNGLRREQQSENWTVFIKGDCPSLILDLNKTPHEVDVNTPNFLLIVYPPQNETITRTRLADVWREIIGLPYIPYDIAKRKEQLTDAYELLGPNIELWERLKSGEQTE